MERSGKRQAKSKLLHTAIVNFLNFLFISGWAWPIWAWGATSSEVFLAFSSPFTGEVQRPTPSATAADFCSFSLNKSNTCFSRQKSLNKNTFTTLDPELLPSDQPVCKTLLVSVSQLLHWLCWALHVISSSEKTPQRCFHLAPKLRTALSQHPAWRVRCILSYQADSWQVWCQDWGKHQKKISNFH